MYVKINQTFQELEFGLNDFKILGIISGEDKDSDIRDGIHLEFSLTDFSRKET